MVGRATDFVFHGQLWLVKQPVLSVIDIYCCKISRFCLPWTVLVCNAADFVWHAIVHWSLRQCRIFNVISSGVIY